MNKLKEDIEKWNQILRNYAGVKIKTNGLGVGARYSFNLFDSLYQHEILGLKDIKEFRDISIYSDLAIYFDEDNESIMRCIHQQNTVK